MNKLSGWPCKFQQSGAGKIFSTTATRNLELFVSVGTSMATLSVPLLPLRLRKIMRVTLDHIHIFSSNISTTIDFFSRMFGANLVWDEEAAGVRNVRMALGSAFLQVYEQPPRAERGGPMHHLGIETDDLDGLIENMKKNGYQFRNHVRDLPKFRYVMVAGPDDLLIELFQCNEPLRWQIKA